MKNTTALLLITMIVTGISTVARKAIMGRVSPIQYEAVSGSLHALFSLTAFFFTKSKLQNIDAESWTMMIFQSLLSITAVFSFMYAIKGSNNLGASSAIVSASPMITLLFSVMFFGERPDAKMIFGMFLILSGTAIVALR